MSKKIIPFVRIVGDRPTKDNINDDEPFVGTKSYKTLLEWIGILDISINRCVMNNAYTADGREVTFYLADQDKILALGSNAAKRLDKMNKKYFKLPHPSGLNRQLNDKDKLKKILDEARDFIYSTTEVKE